VTLELVIGVDLALLWLFRRWAKLLWFWLNSFKNLGIRYRLLAGGSDESFAWSLDVSAQPTTIKTLAELPA
jgi:hypothetical protein